MQSHVKLLGILHIIWGGITVVLGLLILVVFGGIGGLASMQHSENSAAAFPVMMIVGVVVFFLVTCISLPGVICGFGLLRYRNWARIVCLILSVFELLSFPFGTALGIYGLWVLLKPETEALFRGYQA